MGLFAGCTKTCIRDVFASTRKSTKFSAVDVLPYTVILALFGAPTTRALITSLRLVPTSTTMVHSAAQKSPKYD